MSSKRVTVLLLSAATCRACLHIFGALCLLLLDCLERLLSIRAGSLFCGEICELRSSGV